VLSTDEGTKVVGARGEDGAVDDSPDADDEEDENFMG